MMIKQINFMQKEVITSMMSMCVMRVILDAKCTNVIFKKQQLGLNCYGGLGVFKNGSLKIIDNEK